MISPSEFLPCWNCGEGVMKPTEYGYNELYEMNVQMYECPLCGATDEDVRD